MSNEKLKDKIVRLQFEISEGRLKELEDLMDVTGTGTKKELLNNSLTLLEWAVNEKKRGNMIASVNEDEKKYKEITMPILENVKKH
jgi:hypothetical protein